MAVTKTINYTDSNRFSFDAALIEVDGSGSRLVDLGGGTYSTTDPAIEEAGFIVIGNASAFAATVTEPGSDTVTFQLKVNGQKKYWTGSAWADSDGTLAQSNAASVINTNIATLSLSPRSEVIVVSVLHSDDGTSTPEVDQATLTFDFVTPSTCEVTASLNDILGDVPSPNITNAKLIASTDKGFFYGDNYITAVSQEDAFDASGDASLTLVETTTPGITVTFEVVYERTSGSLESIIFRPVMIPNQASVDLSTLTSILPEV